MKRSSWPCLLIGGVALGGLVYYLVDRFAGALSLDSGGFRVVYLVALLALVMSGLLHRRLGLTRIIGSAAVWIAIALLLVLGYSYRAELTGLKDRVMGELLPHSGIAAGDGALSFRRSMGGHFYVEARVEGVPIRFLVDTGASRVVLSQADARRIGIDPARLGYSLRIATANGEARAASVMLTAIEVRDHRVEGVRALVNEAPMSHSLLGMSFLDRLDGYEVRDGALVLRWR
jgi:aspartyl protease family protein